MRAGRGGEEGESPKPSPCNDTAVGESNWHSEKGTLGPQWRCGGAIVLRNQKRSLQTKPGQQLRLLLITIYRERETIKWSTRNVPTNDYEQQD
jgi:hypothetical protein